MMVFVHLLPELIPPKALHGGVTVVIDVLRATTVMVHALVAGCREVIPCLEIADAKDVAAKFSGGDVLLAGERHGVPIEGFDLGNSPEEFTPERCRGKTLVMTTTNGTKALLASRSAEEVIVGSFVNFAATSQCLLHESRPIHLVCAGTEGEISYEDTLMAGALARYLKDMNHTLGNDAAEITAGLWRSVESLTWSDQPVKTPEQPMEARSSLFQFLTKGQGGRRVIELGRVADIQAAAQLNRPHYQIVAELQRDPLRVVARP